ncbi:MAG: maleate cis-trans isomerase family protein [Candidatus Promineifilaceae bacterium]
MDNTTWISMPCTLDDGAAHQAAIGVVALASDVTLEPELKRFLPHEGIGVYVNRIPMPNVVNIESLAQMEHGMTDVAAGILPDDHLDVIIYGCTSGTMTIGADVVEAKIREARPNVAVTDPITAGLKGLQKMGCQRIALLTPYIAEVNEVVERYIEGQGFELVVKGSFDQPGDPQICRVPPQAVYDAALALGQMADVDGVFISCTGLRTSSILEPLEQALGIPVVASNQALAWDALRLAGYMAPIEGFGRLLTL